MAEPLPELAVELSRGQWLDCVYCLEYMIDYLMRRKWPGRMVRVAIHDRADRLTAVLKTLKLEPPLQKDFVKCRLQRAQILDLYRVLEGYAHRLIVLPRKDAATSQACTKEYDRAVDLEAFFSEQLCRCFAPCSPDPAERAELARDYEQRECQQASERPPA